MKQLFLTVLACIIATAGAAQQKTDLEGVWKLDSVELYKHSGNDSVKVSNDLLPEDNAISGVFDTLSFAGDKCKSRIFKMDVENIFSVNGNILKLNFSPAPHTYIYTYTVADGKPQLEMLYRYSRPDREKGYVDIPYSVKLKYHKLNISGDEK